MVTSGLLVSPAASAASLDCLRPAIAQRLPLRRGTVLVSRCGTLPYRCPNPLAIPVDKTEGGRRRASPKILLRGHWARGALRLIIAAAAAHRLLTTDCLRSSSVVHSIIYHTWTGLHERRHHPFERGALWATCFFDLGAVVLAALLVALQRYDRRLAARAAEALNSGLATRWGRRWGWR